MSTRKKKQPDHVFLWDSDKGEWLHRSPSLLKEPYKKPNPSLDKQIIEANARIAALEGQVALLRGIISQALRDK
jgi:hypothetical protein